MQMMYFRENFNGLFSLRFNDKKKQKFFELIGVNCGSNEKFIFGGNVICFKLKLKC